VEFFKGYGTVILKSKTEWRIFLFLSGDFVLIVENLVWFIESSAHLKNIKASVTKN
jgi:hypothetical protein